jgi:hypothetical protein
MRLHYSFRNTMSELGMLRQYDRYIYPAVEEVTEWSLRSSLGGIFNDATAPGSSTSSLILSTCGNDEQRVSWLEIEMNGLPVCRAFRSLSKIMSKRSDVLACSISSCNWRLDDKPMAMSGSWV